MTRGAFAKEVMKRLGITPTLHTRRAWQAELQAEGGSAKNNPTNTTLSMPGSTNYNLVGVKNYISGLQGVEATVKTLKGEGHGYGKVLKLMRQNAPASAIVNAWGESDWGTDLGLVTRVLSDVKEGRKPNRLEELEAKQIAS
jgi:hypothetical protein